MTFIAFLCTVLLSGAAALIWRSAGGSLGIVGAVLLLPAAVGAYLCAVGVFYYVNKAVFFEHPSAADTWKGIRLLLGPAITLFAVDFLITAVLVGDTLFFGRMFEGSRNPVFAALGILMLLHYAGMADDGAVPSAASGRSAQDGIGDETRRYTAQVIPAGRRQPRLYRGASLLL